MKKSHLKDHPKQEAFGESEIRSLADLEAMAVSKLHDRLELREYAPEQIEGALKKFAANISDPTTGGHPKLGNFMYLLAAVDSDTKTTHYHQWRQDRFLGKCVSLLGCSF